MELEISSVGFTEILQSGVHFTVLPITGRRPFIITQDDLRFQKIVQTWQPMNMLSVW